MTLGVMIYGLTNGYNQLVEAALGRGHSSSRPPILLDYSGLNLQLWRGGFISDTKRSRKENLKFWTELGFHVVNLMDSPPHSKIEDKIPSDVANEIALAAEIEERVDLRSLRSFKFWPAAVGFRRLEARNGQLSYLKTRHLIRELSLSELWIFNGRYPLQRGAELAARAEGISLKFLEWPIYGGLGFYLRDYSPRETLDVQRDGRQACSTLDHDAIEEISSAWLTRRAGRELNRESRLRQKKYRISYFSSSLNEAILADTEVEKFRNQFDELDDFLSSFPARPYLLTIRLHPGLADKSPAEFGLDLLKALSVVKKYGGSVVTPFSNFSTYRLVEESDLIVVAHSTVGVEALLLNKTVVGLWPSDYICGAGALRPSQFLKGEKSNALRAKKTVAGNVWIDTGGSLGEELWNGLRLGPDSRKSKPNISVRALRFITRRVRVFLAIFSGLLWPSRDTVWLIRQRNVLVNRAFARLVSIGLRITSSRSEPHGLIVS